MDFSYDVFESFNIGGFLCACDRAGIRLYADRPDDTANGFIDINENDLKITLVEKDEWIGPLFLKKLPRELSVYRPLMDKLIKEHNQ